MNGRRVSSSNAAFTFDNVTLEHVKVFKCLGCIISQSLNETPDIQRIINCFIKSVGCFVRKFSGVHFMIEECLLHSLCMSLYGLETVVNSRGCKKSFDRLGISYHYALKTVLGLPNV